MRLDTTIQRETDIRQKILLHKLTAVEFEAQNECEKHRAVIENCE